MTYQDFLRGKAQIAGAHGFKPLFAHPSAFDFQGALIEWALERGRAAIMADCGLGKTFMELVWAQNVVQATNRPVLIATPLAVSHQTLREAARFGIDAVRSTDGKIPAGAKIVVTNYERLHHFRATDFAGAVGDESSILKNFEGKMKALVTEFFRTLRYRLLCTATAAPNDWIELGTSSEALGEMGYVDMLSSFFKKDDGIKIQRAALARDKYSLRGHAERAFWRWVCSWARMVRRPSDLGFSDTGFTLPPLVTREHIIESTEAGWSALARSLPEQRQEARRSMPTRCARAAALANAHANPVVAWCHTNAEGDMLTRSITGAAQVSGADSDERKEEIFEAFAAGQIRALVTKPTIAGFGLNWQHCAHSIYFASHSFERWYQAVRRFWRFGQKQTVTVDLVASEGEGAVLDNLYRKQAAAEVMAERLVEMMREELDLDPETLCA